MQQEDFHRFLHLAQDFRRRQKCLSTSSAAFSPKSPKSIIPRWLYPPEVICELCVNTKFFLTGLALQTLPWWEEMELQVENSSVVAPGQGKDAKLQLYPFQSCSVLMGRVIPGSTSAPPVPRAFMKPSPLWRDKQNRRTTCKWQCLSSSYLNLYENGWFWEPGALTESLRPQNADIT